jgi:hypothetical protein
MHILTHPRTKVAVLAIVLLLLPALSAQAQCADPRSFTAGMACILSAVSGDLVTTKTIPEIIRDIVLFLLSLAAVLALAALIMGGIWYIVSLGDEDRARTAKRMILYALVGLLIIGISFVLIATIGAILAPGTGGGTSTLRTP